MGQKPQCLVIDSTVASNVWAIIKNWIANLLVKPEGRVHRLLGLAQVTAAKIGCLARLKDILYSQVTVATYQKNIEKPETMTYHDFSFVGIDVGRYKD